MSTVDRDREGERIDRHVVANEVARGLVNAMYERYRWRPIADLHEDFGACVGVNIHEPGYIVIVHACDMKRDSLVTHFTRFAPLDQSHVDRLLKDMKHDPDVDPDYERLMIA